MLSPKTILIPVKNRKEDNLNKARGNLAAQNGAFILSLWTLNTEHEPRQNFLEKKLNNNEYL